MFAIQTQGRDDTWERWAYTYRVEYSEDCNTFNKVLDPATGLHQVRGFADRLIVLASIVEIKSQMCLPSTILYP